MVFIQFSFRCCSDYSVSCYENVRGEEGGDRKESEASLKDMRAFLAFFSVVLEICIWDNDRESTVHYALESSLIINYYKCIRLKH